MNYSTVYKSMMAGMQKQGSPLNSLGILKALEMVAKKAPAKQLSGALKLAPAALRDKAATRKDLIRLLWEKSFIGKNPYAKVNKSFINPTGWMSNWDHLGIDFRKGALEKYPWLYGIGDRAVSSSRQASHWWDKIVKTEDFIASRQRKINALQALMDRGYKYPGGGTHPAMTKWKMQVENAAKNMAGFNAKEQEALRNLVNLRKQVPEDAIERFTRHYENLLDGPISDPRRILK